jgi:hypothetical protein
MTRFETHSHWFRDRSGGVGKLLPFCKFPKCRLLRASGAKEFVCQTGFETLWSARLQAGTVESSKCSPGGESYKIQICVATQTLKHSFYWPVEVAVEQVAEKVLTLSFRGALFAEESLFYWT